MDDFSSLSFKENFLLLPNINSNLVVREKITFKSDNLLISWDLTLKDGWRKYVLNI